MQHTKIPQDLHIHTVFSTRDSSIVEAQTIELVAQVRHAEIMGISDHFDHIADTDEYINIVHQYGFYAGTEVDGGKWASEAVNVDFDYYIQHTRNKAEDYKGLENLLATGKPVIVPHPITLETDLRKVPGECYIEINNRYVWRNDWQSYYLPFLNQFSFVFGSDAHQPHWLNQNIARMVGQQLGVKERILFPPFEDTDEHQDKTTLKVAFAG